jgi:hypothetical protein
MSDIKITFFMLVTDRDIIIADFAVRSYQKIKDISFKLQVYSNWISADLKQKYFPAWRLFDFVEIIEHEWQTEDKKPTDRGLEGPFELCATVWDRELNKIETPYYATVDADFEILDSKFIPVMLAELDSNPNTIAMSTDYSKTQPSVYDSYSDEIICLNERWHTWFCIYKREALNCNVPHAYYEEIVSGPVKRNAWDETAYFQKALKEDFGFELAVIHSDFQNCFIHYGQFSKNTDINESNVNIYRQLQIINKRGMFGIRNKLVAKLTYLAYKYIFTGIDNKRGKYVGGWGAK